MLEGGKNIKDTSFPIKDTEISVPIEKTRKLVTAMYMVTDIMPEHEPIRIKLRDIGLGLLLDINSIKIFALKDTIGNARVKIESILSVLSIGFTLGMVSEMNYLILKKEFDLLLGFIEQKTGQSRNLDQGFSLSDFLAEEENTKNSYSLIGQVESTRIGVQKGGDLLKVLSNVNVSNKGSSVKDKYIFNKDKDSQEMLKKERRFEIVRIIKDKSKDKDYKGLTITDIKNSARGVLLSCSEKTLQRELVSMVTDGVLYKKGLKRWSHYFLKESV